MVATVHITDVAALPLAPKNPLPYRQLLHAFRVFHTGQEIVRDAGGPVTRVSFGPKWLVPPAVVATSAQAARDVLGRKDTSVDKHIVHREMRQLLEDNLFDLMHERWLPRILMRSSRRTSTASWRQSESPICVMWSCSAALAPKSRAGGLLPQGPRVAGSERQNDANSADAPANARFSRRPWCAAPAPRRSTPVPAEARRSRVQHGMGVEVVVVEVPQTHRRPHATRCSRRSAVVSAVGGTVHPGVTRAQARSPEWACSGLRRDRCHGNFDALSVLPMQRVGFDPYCGDGRENLGRPDWDHRR